MTTGIIMILIFLFMAVMMYLEKISTILVLPLMAVSFAIVAVTSNLISTGIPADAGNVLAYVFDQYFSLISDVLANGSYALHKAIITTVFGGMLAVYIKNLKIAEKMVYWTAEFAGDKPLVISIALFAVTMLLFTSIGGLGSIIMVGTIMLPILASVGVSAIAGAGIFLLAVCAGGTMMPQMVELYVTTFNLPQEEVTLYTRTIAGVYVIVAIIWMLFTIKGSSVSNFWAEKIKQKKTKLSPLAFLSPIIPVILVYKFKINPIVAFVIALVYTFLVFSRNKGAVRLFCKSIIEGSQIVMPACVLMLGIGILYYCVKSDDVKVHLKPIIEVVIPHSKLMYVIGFGIFAPLALYRGPLNTWGLGFGLAALIGATGILPAKAVMGMLVSVGMVQGVCDPTNTHNVWIASYQGISPNVILRKTLPFVWVGVFGALTITALFFFK